jgi:hypothetical protein
MSIYKLDISWAITANERRQLRWELLACERVRGVFLTARDDVLAVLFSGDRLDFDSWARALESDRAFDTRTAHANTKTKGALR